MSINFALQSIPHRKASASAATPWQENYPPSLAKQRPQSWNSGRKWDAGLVGVLWSMMLKASGFAGARNDNVKDYERIRNKSVEPDDSVIAINFLLHGLLTSDFTEPGIVSSVPAGTLTGGGGPRRQKLATDQRFGCPNSRAKIILSSSI
jgi:hypothetical protein